MFERVPDTSVRDAITVRDRLQISFLILSELIKIN